VLGETASAGLADDLLLSIVFLRPLSNADQHIHARLEIRLRDTGQQFVSKFVGGCLNLRDHPLGSSAEEHHLAAAIIRRAIPCDPALLFKTV